MGNLGHFDPSLQSRNVVGMSNASKLDEQVVKEFLDNWEELAVRARKIEAEYLKTAQSEEAQIEELPEGLDNITETKQSAVFPGSCAQFLSPEVLHYGDGCAGTAGCQSYQALGR